MLGALGPLPLKGQCTDCLRSLQPSMLNALPVPAAEGGWPPSWLLSSDTRPGAQNTALCLELIIWRQFSRRSREGHGSGPCGTKERSGRKAEVYMARHRPAGSKANGPRSPQGGNGVRKLTYCKQDEVLLVVLADTVIDPGTVVVHFPNAPLADTERAERQTLRGVPTEAGGPRGLRTHAPPHSSQAVLGRHTVFRCVCAGRA